MNLRREIVTLDYEDRSNHKKELIVTSSRFAKKRVRSEKSSEIRFAADSIAGQLNKILFQQSYKFRLKLGYCSLI